MFRFINFKPFASVLFALPMLIAACNPSPFGILDVIGIVIWFIALAGETTPTGSSTHFEMIRRTRGKSATRFVAIFETPELFLRVDTLVVLRIPGDQLPNRLVRDYRSAARCYFLSCA